MAQPSRQDLHGLMSGNAGVFFNQECLSPETSRFSCDIRTSDTIQEGLLPNTKGLLLLGERAFKEWTTKGSYDTGTLNEHRGTPLLIPQGLPTICSYLPQDCLDIQNYEARLNPLLNGEKDNGEEKEGETSEYEEKKRHGRTSRSNYRHWLRRDTKKILGAISSRPSQICKRNNWNVRLYPRSEEIISALESYKDGYLYLDIETDLDWNCLCIGLNHSSSDTVFSVPLLRCDYKLAYGDFARILRSIVRCFRREGLTVVIHNSMFDLFVLAWKYRIPPPRRVYDTMIAQHRIFPEAEKSLGHCLSSWREIMEPFHKDEGVFMPWNIEQEKQLWNYNAKDVYGMRLVHEAQMRYMESAEAPQGLVSSIAQGNRCIRPFLLMSLQGIEFDDTLRQEMLKKNDRLMTQYLRGIQLLIGQDWDVLPTSSKSCVRYFHGGLGYKVAGRTPTGEPSLDETNLLKLKLKHPENVVIDFVIKFRQKKKESGMLNFEPWITP